MCNCYLFDVNQMKLEAKYERNSITFQIYLVILLLCYSHLVYSITIQKPKYWGSLNVNGNLFKNQKALYYLNLQGRIDGQESQFEQSIFVGGVGYQWLPHLSLWLGYQRNSYNQIGRSEPQNAVWEQAIWKIINNNCINLTSRTRLEQREQVDQSQWVSRLRERITLKLPQKINKDLTPAIYDEIFINLNNPTWVNSRSINENRFFMGVDIPTSKKSYLEVGYLNQYRWLLTSNNINHILSISLYIET